MSIQTRTTAIQNEMVRLYCRFISDGVLSDPMSQPIVSIMDTDGITPIREGIMAEKESQGVFFVEWAVPTLLPCGQYYDKWTFQWNGNTCIEELTMIFEVHSLENYINFISTGLSYNVSSRGVQLLSDLANDMIYEAMHIPVYWEQGRRIQQDTQKKRLKNYYYFTVIDQYPTANEGDIYTVNGAQYTVFTSIVDSSSSSNSISESSSLSIQQSSVNSSESSASTGSSFSISSDTSQSSLTSITESDESNSSNSLKMFESESDGNIFQKILVCVSNLNPPANGILTRVKGDGSTTLTYSSYAVKTSKFSTIYETAYKNWIQEPRPLVRLNNRIIDDGWHADYEGRIYFDRMLTPEDSVNVSYTFAYFSKEELLSFLQFGLQMMNSVPPASAAYSALSLAPMIWGPGIVLYAAITALKRLIFGLTFQERMIIFGTPEMAQQAQAKFQELYSSYQEVWTAYAKNVKTNKLPNINAYVTPEYSLPGGRSRWFRYLYKGGSG